MTNRSSQSDLRTSSGGGSGLRVAILFTTMAFAALAASACTGGSQNDWKTTSLQSPASLAATAGSSYGSTDSSVSAALEASSGVTDNGPSQPQTKDLKIGKGRAVGPGSTVTMEYTGWLMNGKKFGSSADDHHPLTFTVGTGEVILGLDTGVKGMKVGGSRELIIPAVFAYNQQVKKGIPPGSALKFHVKVLSIK